MKRKHDGPTLHDQVGVVYSSTGYKVLFYEDPDLGDEVELLALVSNQLVRTDWFDLPGRFELDDWLKDLGVN